MAKDCNFCVNCETEGHTFFQCILKKDYSKITCPVCKQSMSTCHISFKPVLIFSTEGHTKKKCPQAQDEGFGGSGGGFGSGDGFGGGFDTTASGGNWGSVEAGGSGSWDDGVGAGADGADGAAGNGWGGEVAGGENGWDTSGGDGGTSAW